MLGLIQMLFHCQIDTKIKRAQAMPQQSQNLYQVALNESWLCIITSDFVFMIYHSDRIWYFVQFSGSNGYRIRNIISSDDWLRIIKRWNLPRNRCEDNFRCCCCLVILSLEKSEALRSKNEWGRIKIGENKDGRWLL